MSDLQSICDEFNAKYPVDTKGFLRKDDGSVIATRTRARAQVLSGHTAVIWVEGVTGCYLLDRFTPGTTPSSKGADHAE